MELVFHPKNIIDFFIHLFFLNIPQTVNTRRTKLKIGTWPLIVPAAYARVRSSCSRTPPCLPPYTGWRWSLWCSVRCISHFWDRGGKNSVRYPRWGRILDHWLEILTNLRISPRLTVVFIFSTRWSTLIYRNFKDRRLSLFDQCQLSFFLFRT